MHLILRGAAALALTLTATSAAAQPLTFDDRTLGQPVTPLGATYGGFEFTNFFVGNDAGPGTGAGAVSGAQYAYVGNNPLVPYGEIYRPERFDALSGWFGYRSTGALLASATVTVRGFGVGGEELFTESLTLTGSSTFFTCRMPLVDAVEFDLSGLTAQTGAGAGLTVDDLRIGVGDLSVSTVPEPGTVLLLATGLAGLGGVALRRRRRA